MNPPKKLSPEQALECKKMYLDGLSTPKIAKIFKVSSHCISLYLQGLGVEMRRSGPAYKLSTGIVEECKQMYSEGISTEKIGAMYGVSDGCVKTALRKAGVKMHQVGEYCRGKRVAQFQNGEWVRYEGSEKRKEDKRRSTQKSRKKFDMLGAIQRAKARAKEKGFPFSLHPEDIRVPELCPVLGIKMTRYTGRGGPMDDSPTLDRIVNELGYVSGNVRVISNKANRIKTNATCEEVALVLADMRVLFGRSDGLEGDDALWL
jgi:DNA-binding CsgD family transcriptional regulator